MSEDRLDPWFRGVLFGFAALYLAYPSYVYYFDGVTFAMAVEGVAGGASPQWLLHPHHLLYNFLAYAAFRGVTAAGAYPRALEVMQWLSSLLAVLGLRLFYGVLRGIGLPSPAALAGSVLLGFSYGYWHFATTGDTTMAATVSLIAELAVAVRYLRSSSSLALPALMGGLQALSLLMHETTAVFAPAALWLVWRGAPSSRRWTACLAFVGTAALLTVSAYVISAVTILGVHTPRQFFSWLFFYFGPDPRTGYYVEYGSVAPSNLLASARAWLAMFVGYPPDQPGAASVPWKAASYLAVPVLLSAIAAALRNQTAAEQREWAILRESLVFWLMLHAAVFTWWDVGNVHFWVMALPAWCLLAAVGAARLGRGAMMRPLGVAWWAPALVTLALFGGPFQNEIVPTSNRFLPIAEAIGARTEPDATVIISGEGKYSELKAYVPYIARRRMIVLDFQFADKTAPSERALAALGDRIRQLSSDGGAYLLSEVLDEALDEHFSRRHGLSGSARRAFFQSFHPEVSADITPTLRLLRLRAS